MRLPTGIAALLTSQCVIFILKQIEKEDFCDHIGGDIATCTVPKSHPVLDENSPTVLPVAALQKTV